MGIAENFRTGAKTRNFYLIFRAIRRLRNWPAYFFDFLGLVRGKRLEYAFRSGVRIRVRPGTADRGVMTAVGLADEYRLKGLSLCGGTVIDIGGHIGCFSIACAATGARVFAYEPMADSFELLSENIRVNGYGQRITAFPYAVWSKSGIVPIHRAAQNAMHSVFGTGVPVEAQAVSIEEIFACNGIRRCALLKLDAEGAEWEILAAAPKEIFGRIDRIHLEFHDELLPGSCARIMGLLGDNGFAVVRSGTYVYAVRADGHA